jgi:hypothetical protein
MRPYGNERPCSGGCLAGADANATDRHQPALAPALFTRMSSRQIDHSRNVRRAACSGRLTGRPRDLMADGVGGAPLARGRAAGTPAAARARSARRSASRYGLSPHADDAGLCSSSALSMALSSASAGGRRCLFPQPAATATVLAQDRPWSDASACDSVIAPHRPAAIRVGAAEPRTPDSRTAPQWGPRPLNRDAGGV